MTMDSTYPTPRRTEALAFDDAFREAEHIMLEIGTGSYPYIGMEDNRERFDGSTIYVAWNIDLLQHNYLTEEFLGPNMYSVFAGLEDDKIFWLLPEESVDEILLSDVLGEPNSSNIHIDNPAFNPDGKGYRGMTTTDQKKHTLNVAKRLLKPGGTITIVETISPHGYFKDYQRLKEPLGGKDLENVGFADVELTNVSEWATPEEKDRLIGRYCINPDDASPNSYIVKATKR